MTPSGRRPNEPGAPPRIAVVVLTWDAKDDTLACVRALLPQCDPGDLIVISDNGSVDGTTDAIAREYPLDRTPALRCIQNGRNLGFAGGVNAGLRVALDAGCNWILALNNDTEVSADLLAGLRGAIDAQGSRFAVLQPLLVRAADPGAIDSAGLEPRPFPGARDLLAGRAVEVLGTDAREIFGACGAAMLCRRDVLEVVGLFDEDLFVLFEDLDLAFRIRAAGFDVGLLSDLRIPHRRGVSASRGARSSVARARRRFWVQRNTIAVGLRAWPWTRLVWASPILAWRAVDALLLARKHGPRTCLRLWRRALAERAALRAGLRRHDADRFLARGFAERTARE